jgi:hypothetical protein
MSPAAIATCVWQYRGAASNEILKAFDMRFFMDFIPSA